ncbi:MAG: hypothetical protein CVV21_11470 [Candidatus Goldiibacteriota bacterium HGW-Goldbacteria-1]|jgi:hypothetical protein|nr:MAG: hypothetical protein CVV21_11470 [Candidatus Goldiibacteriota bacterium HGW-Goldbacteria-1]
MKIKDWEVWHTYTTYFSNEIPDLYKVAKQLLKNGIAELAVHSDGSFYWLGKENIRQGAIEFQSSESVNYNKVQFNTKDGKPADYDAFIEECLLISTKMKFESNRIFGDDINLMEPNLRVFTGLCKLLNKETGFEVNCYPVITLYSNGILIVSFRIIGTPSKIEIDDFIEYGQNLSKLFFDEAKCPPGFGIWAPVAGKLSRINNFIYIKKVLKNPQYVFHRKEFEKRITEENVGDFKFKFAALTKSVEKETLSGLVQTVFRLIGLFINAKEKHIIWNYSEKQNKQGDFWQGRPNIYIIKHSNQNVNAKDNFKQNKNDFIKILAQGQNTNMKNDDKIFVTEDLRYFDDYNVFITSVVTLTIWSKKGISTEQELVDVNNGHLIYDKQVLAETLEFGYMLYKAIIDRILKQNDPNIIFLMKKDLSQFKYKMNNMGHYGEIREMLKKGWKEYGVENLQHYLNDLTAIQSSHIEWKESKDTAKRDRILTVVLGVLAAPGIAQTITIPLWDYFKWPLPKIKLALVEPFITVVTLMFMLLCLLPFLFSKKLKITL